MKINIFKDWLTKNKNVIKLSSVKFHKMKNQKNFAGFFVHEIKNFKFLKLFAETFYSAQTTYFWRRLKTSKKPDEFTKYFKARLCLGDTFICIKHN